MTHSQTEPTQKYLTGNDHVLFLLLKKHISTIIFMFDINSLEYKTKINVSEKRSKKKKKKGRRKINYHQAIHTE